MESSRIHEGQLTRPEPSVLLVLDRIDKVLAHLVGRGLRVALLARNNLAQLLFVPVLHRVLLLALDAPHVLVQVLLLLLPLDAEVVRELALLACPPPPPSALGSSAAPPPRPNSPLSQCPFL